MARLFLFGAVCSVLAVVVLGIGQLLKIDFQNVVYGVAAGAILGLVRMRPLYARVGAYLIGFCIAAGFYVIRLAFLPGTWVGNAVAIVIAIMLVTVIAAFTLDRVPMWAMFLGLMTFVGAYNGYFLTTPWLFETQAVSTASAILVSVAAGLVVAILVEFRVLHGGVDPIDPLAPAPANVTPPQDPQDPNPAGPPMESTDAGLAVLGTTTKGAE